MNDKENKEEKMTLEVLDAVGRKSDISQRHLAQELGVALGLANSYLKRCIRKGLIKISDAPANRYLYYLTPKGFAEKSRLTGRYLKHSFSFYRQAGDSCRKAYTVCAERGWERIVLCGISDLAEIAILRSYETTVDIVGIYDPHTERDRFVNHDICHDLSELPDHDGFLITDLNAPKVSYEYLASKIGAENIIVPDVLRLDTSDIAGS
ncbi:MAG TPA: winged helix-turn-helix transcriptional regulator [Gammaproteobacteria bacterium]|nr:winged helix-turn-helix transcriptional regulator [Gammaproteobacteria bacterium]